MRSRFAIFAPVAAVMLAIAACGGDDDTGDDSGSNEATVTAAASDDTGDATDSPEETEPATDDDTDGGTAVHTCDLITAEEVSAAVGFAVQEGNDYLATAPGATQCEWPGTVYAEVLTEGGPDWFESIHFGEPAFEEIEVPGLGDQALYADGLNTLDVVSGDTFVAVQIIGAGFAGVDELASATALAEAILGKLE